MGLGQMDLGQIDLAVVIPMDVALLIVAIVTIDDSANGGF